MSPESNEAKASSSFSHGGPGPVEVGFFSFTEITGAEHHRAYNEWHQLDHLPEQIPLPGIVAGQRWVSTPACREARLWTADVDPALAPTHYMTLYLVTGPVQQSLAEFFDLAEILRREGRFFAHRRALLSGPFAVEAVAAAPRARVSAAAVPYRPNRGVYVSLEETSPTVGEPMQPAPPQQLLNHGGVAGVWTFRSDQKLKELGGQSRGLRITVCFLDGDVLGASPGLQQTLVEQAARDEAKVRLAGPFEAITPWRWDWFDDEAT